MGDILALHHGQGGSHADTVVGAQRRAVRLQPVAVADQPDRIDGEIVDGAFVLFANHIQMALQNGRNRSLAPGPGGLSDHDIPDTVLRRFESQPGGQGQDVVTRRRLLFRRPRDRREGIEVLPQKRGFQVV